MTEFIRCNVVLDIYNDPDFVERSKATQTPSDGLRALYGFDGLSNLSDPVHRPFSPL
jgi:hypothetical protein